MLSPLATVVAVRPGGDLGDEAIARLLPQAPGEGAGLTSESLLPILRDGVEVALLQVERTFADGSAFVGRSFGGRGMQVREGDQVFAPAAVEPPAEEAPETDRQRGRVDDESAEGP